MGVWTFFGCMPKKSGVWSAASGAAEKATREVDWEKFLENRTLQQAPAGKPAFPIPQYQEPLGIPVSDEQLKP